MAPTHVPSFTIGANGNKGMNSKYFYRSQNLWDNRQNKLVTVMTYEALKNGPEKIDPQIFNINLYRR